MNCEESYNAVKATIQRAISVSVAIVELQVRIEEGLKAMRESNRTLPGPMRLDDVLVEQKEKWRVIEEVEYDLRGKRNKVRTQQAILRDASHILTQLPHALNLVIRMDKDSYVTLLDMKDTGVDGLVLSCTADGTVTHPPYYTLGELYRERKEQEPEPEPDIYDSLQPFGGFELDGE